jgi:hypothetical protein
LKRLFTPPLLVAAFVAVSAAAPAAASAASCSPSAAGGEKAPALTGGGASFSESGNGGYSCTVAWRALVTPQYEAGGVWHTATEFAPRLHGDYASGSGHNWQDTGFTPTASADTPACSVNWRFTVDFFNTGNGNNFQTAASPQRGKTC